MSEPSDSNTARATTNENASLCDYRALQACLAQHNGDRTQCMAEWEAFQQACAANKRRLAADTECEPCKLPSDTGA